MFRSERFNQILDRALQIIVLAYQATALMVLLVVPFLAMNWLQLPFLGGFIEQTMIVNRVHPADRTAWPLLQQVPGLGYQVVQVAGTDVPRTADLRAVLGEHHTGETVTVQLKAPSSQIETYEITLQVFPSRDRFGYLYFPYFIGLIYLVTSLWIFGMRRVESAGRAFALFATSVAIVGSTLFDVFTTHTLTYIWTFALSFAGGALIDLSLSFPQEVRWVHKHPYLRWAGYFIALALAVETFINLNNFSHPMAYYYYGWRVIYFFDGAAVLFFVAILLYHAFFSRSPVIKNQTRTILASILLSFTWLAGWFILHKPASTYNPYMLIPLVIFPLVTGYTILRFRLLQTDFLFRQGALYALLAILVFGGYALLVSGLTLIFGQAFSAKSPWFIGILALIVALVLNPLYNRLRQFVDNIFFRGRRAYEQRLRDFNREVTNLTDLTAIVHALREHINNSLMPVSLHIFSYDPINDQYLALAGEGGRPTSDLRFTPVNPLTQALSRTRLPIFFDEASPPPELKSEQTRLALLGAALFVPLLGTGRPIGWLALGRRQSGEDYTGLDLNFLSDIANQAAVAIERAQVIFNLERHVREMNILSRVAQGINVTVAFDDILELISAQTAQVLPLDDFYITLYNKENDYHYYAFCLSGEERLTEKENIPLPSGRGLSQDIIATHHSIVTTDYNRECQARGFAPSSSTKTLAWAGVPMNAGAETIGALSIGSRNAGVAYTPAQVELLQSIADQAAGAIVKARLLQETERRARQLVTLNEIARQLTGTLRTEPLLQNILDNAVSILNCEAGSLFLVDETTDELIFKATVGPVAQNLAGQRLAPGTGIVGKAVQTRQPVVANNVHQTPSWSAATDQTTGFVTHSILAIPMQVKERVIGVVEVINRKDGLPFAEDDQNLLAAFASQAAVAIENARLYTLTDQELNARVEELSVMQRIDRELNASLDVARAMRLTLEWALRQSNAAAGMIGILEERGLRLMAQQGYDEIEQTYKSTAMPLEQPAIRLASETGQPQRVALDEEHPGLLAGARTQSVVPIRRESKVIGLVVLESRATESLGSQEEMVFLSRLSDHAAIAIANAQLYAEVQRANDAKSEFVSFVAHELKNPMTSIKGYTELLSKGAVGPVTDMQGNFLKTIHSNVERMSTLVSDLNDNSKIEAGRLRLDFKAVDMAEVLDETARSVKRQVDDKKQTINVKTPAKLPKVWADPTRLEQIIVNLVSNANKYTPESGIITVGAEKSGNRWDAEGAAEVVHIWVQDNGIGISLEDQKNIFQKFFRSDDQKARESPGTGLGLNITKSLVEMMGGRIWFESEFRQGTTFHFTVPVAEK